MRARTTPALGLLVGLAVAGGTAPDPWRKRTQPLQFVIKESEIESWKSWTGPLISERYRLILWALPKVGCTDMMRLFYRMAGHETWRELPWFKSRSDGRDDIALSARKSPARIQALLNNKSYTRAVFFRDPVERLLSAYLDKISIDVRAKNTTMISKMARQMLKSARRPSDVAALSLADFVELLEIPVRPQREWKGDFHLEGLTKHSNPHWRPQSMLVHPEWLGMLDFVGSFKHLAEHMEALLRRVGAWADHGAAGWAPPTGAGVNLLLKRMTPGSKQRYLDLSEGDGAGGAIFRAGQSPHATSARDKLAEWYDSRLLERTRALYADDYAMLQRLGVDL